LVGFAGNDTGSKTLTFGLGFIADWRISRAAVNRKVQL